jgi:hypothetical protein
MLNDPRAPWASVTKPQRPARLLIVEAIDMELLPASAHTDSQPEH